MGSRRPSFDSYEEALNFLVHEMNMSSRGDFGLYDKNSSGKITKDEFDSTFKVESRNVPGRYFYEDGPTKGQPTWIYDWTIAAAKKVFKEKGSVLTRDQWDREMDPREMGHRARKAVDPYLNMAKDIGEDFLTWGKGAIPPTTEFLKGFIEGDNDQPRRRENGHDQQENGAKYFKGSPEQRFKAADVNPRDGILSRKELDGFFYPEGNPELGKARMDNADTNEPKANRDHHELPPMRELKEYFGVDKDKIDLSKRPTELEKPPESAKQRRGN